MELSITEQALAKVKELKSANQHYLALTYDTEGCGCGVNGMPTINWKAEKENSDLAVECEEIPVVVHYQQKVFFAKKMTLDYNGQTFRLTSPEGVLNPFISPMTIN
ncbi:iron-sulfur cluster biosynthesis family protein [Gracilibacillus oryzae]|uniref:Iron-sulfur cluster biosynthesis family protein n=1 Tax=Gracilibacillus oryzae TaxID=1672701 RepID=A0A7C8KTV8_9BACI|nr:iron-sulfur cluster biosynthesis family protein [Gracilibacillus oryzae]KAB8138397.1 iron-sulfur cluster biosynthesis family protein [Gracilibacillus oryzae]